MNYYLEFLINKINFAVPIKEVKEIVRPKSVLQEKKIPRNLVGFFRLRDRKIPLYDLPKIFKLDAEDVFEVILSEIRETYIGFKVTKVLGIIKSETLLPFPELVKPMGCFEGLVQDDGRLVQVLSLEKIMSPVRFKTLKKYL